MLPETIFELSKIENIVAVKEASGSVKAVGDIISLCGDNMTVYSGDDDLIVPMMSMGAKGVISVLSNIMPKETHNLCDLCFNEKYKTASKMQIEYGGLIKALFSEVNPIPVKTAMNLMGLNAGILRLPLYEMEEKNLENLRKQLKSHNLI
jgi:4-hydroxy-tetrahydrodipicolinate synthase